MINKKIMISGGFDPIHIGHIKMIKAASRWGMVTVVINSDAWLKRKKGYVFMPYDERAAIVSNIIGVTMVSSVDDRDGTVCEAIRRLKPDAFANGGDRLNLILKNLINYSRRSIMFLILIMNLAIAQEKDRSVIYRKKTEIDFEGVDISGQLVKPQGALLLDRKRASFNPLIKLRTDFNPEMSASVTDIK